jgi:hypothetical protein
MEQYQSRQPGEILRLATSLPYAEPGLYLLLEPQADVVTLCRLEAEAETGLLVATADLVRVAPTDLSCFHRTGITGQFDVDPLAVYEIAVDDIVKPRLGASVPTGLYQVIELDGEDILLSRLHSNEDGKLATSSRLSWIARSELPMFRKMRIPGDLLPGGE